LEREKRRNPYLMKDAQRYDYDAILANNFEALRPALIAIDEYIAGLERRRDAVSDKIEKRKSSFARLSTESVIDADYEDLSDPPAQPQSEERLS